jgi:hypothetical protein
MQLSNGMFSTNRHSRLNPNVRKKKQLKKVLNKTKKTKKMNKNEKVFFSAINNAERMSGIDSYDSAEGDMSAFDDNAMSGAEGDAFSYADDAFSYAGGASAPQLSQPYVFSFKETSGADVSAVIFGFNDNFNQANFGNAATTVITNLQTGTIAGYGRMVAQSNNKQFKIGKFRFQSADAAQLQQTVQIVHTDANGNTMSQPMNLSIEKDAYQQQSDLLDVVRVVTIDGNTSLTFTLKANATLTISMFPVVINNPKVALNGGRSINSAKAPRLSGGNVAPVIINTGGKK